MECRQNPRRRSAQSHRLQEAGLGEEHRRKKPDFLTETFRTWAEKAETEVKLDFHDISYLKFAARFILATMQATKNCRA